MESQLAAYRARKAKEGNYKFTATDLSDKTAADHLTCQKEVETHRLNADTNIADGSSGQHAALPWITQFLQRHNIILTKPLFLKVLLWCILFVLFVILEFAAVFFILTLFYLVYASMRSGVARKPGELSAYSVFNPNCERIDGTLTAEQFEREMMYGPGSVK